MPARLARLRKILAAGLSVIATVGLLTVAPSPANASVPTPNSDWTYIGHANNLTALACNNNFLFATDRNNTLWFRDRIVFDETWTNLGHANNVVGLGMDGPILFAATSDNRLWWQDWGTVPTTQVWDAIDHANNVVGMTAFDGELYVATSDNGLWVRPAAIVGGIDWTPIDTAFNIVGLGALNRPGDLGDSDYCAPAGATEALC
jgi:hypothetical protein